MSIILSVNELLEAARDARVRRYAVRPLEAQVEAVISAVHALAQGLATAEGVTLHDVSDQPGFGGLMATFKPGPTGHTSTLLAECDPGGTWED